MSTNIRTELVESSARLVEGQPFFLALTLLRVSLDLSHVVFSFPHPPPAPPALLFRADCSINSGQKLVDALYVLQIRTNICIDLFDLWVSCFICWEWSVKMASQHKLFAPRGGRGSKQYRKRGETWKWK